MKISYLGISERNCTKENGERFAQIECNNAECDKMVEALQNNSDNWEFDVFGEGENENTIYVIISNKDEYDYFKNWYKSVKNSCR